MTNIDCLTYKRASTCRHLVLPLIVLSLLTLSGCREAEKATPVELRLFAAAGLRKAVDELVVEFRNESGIAVIPDYAGSGMILARAQEDREADLFMPADTWYVDRLHEKTGLVSETRTVGFFVPVIIVQKGNPKGIMSLMDLYRDDVSVGLGKADACQIGRLCDEILKRNSFDRADIKHLKESLTVNELGLWVKMKDIDAAIAWDAIAANYSDEIDMIEIPRKRNITSQIVVGLLSGSKHPAEGRAFVDFITGAKGRNILKKHSFRVDPPYSEKR